MSRVSASVAAATSTSLDAVTEDGDAHDAEVALGGVVVEEGDRQVGAVRVAEQGRR